MSKVLHPTTSEYDALIKEGIAFVDFYADWCGPCKMLAPELEKLADAYENVKVIKINVDQEPLLAQRYRVSSIPALFIFKDGTLVDKELGYRPFPQLKTMVDKHL